MCPIDAPNSSASAPSAMNADLDHGYVATWATVQVMLSITLWRQNSSVKTAAVITLPANTTNPTVKGSQAICFTITDSDGAGG